MPTPDESTAGPGLPAGGTVDDTGERPANVTLELSRGGTVVAPPVDLLDLPTIGRERYQSLAEHARGGLGRVVRAQDRHLRRPVAIKEMLEPDREGPGGARFVREALVTARLQHPGIVPVYDAGYWPSGEPFYAMKLVSGRTLSDAITAAKGIEERLALLPQVLAAAQAVAYAHSQSIIHRDLKPSNVMLGPYGETVVVDWGLAKDLHAADAIADVTRPVDVYELSHYEMTRVGSVVGTPGYMPPEQAAGEAVDERADVYSLGALLYAVLAGTAPPAKKDVPPVDLLGLGAPRDLVAIVTKAMSSAPADRYANAGQMAEDLSRFLAGQLVSARRYGALTRAARFFSRRRVPLAFAAALIVVLAVTAVESVRRILRERGAARARSAQLVLSQAGAYIERDPTATLAWLKQYPEDGPEIADAAALAADAVSRGVARHVFYAAQGDRLVGADVSPDGKWIACLGKGELTIRDAGSGAISTRLDVSGSLRVAFTPSGDHVAAFGGTGAVWVAAVPAGVPRKIGSHRDAITAHAFSSDGRWLATGSNDGEVRVFDLSSGNERVHSAHKKALTGMAFASDGRLFTSAMDGAVYEWTDASSAGRELHRDGEPILALRADPSSGVFWVQGPKVWRYDGSKPAVFGTHDRVLTTLQTLAGEPVTGGTDGQLLRWPSAAEAPIKMGSLGGAITALAVRGPIIASADERGEIRLFRGADEARLHGHMGVVRILRPLADGRLLSMGDDGAARLWEPAPARRLLYVGNGDVSGLVWAPSSDAIGASCRDGTVRWFESLAMSVEPLGRHDGVVYDVAVTPDGQTLVTGGWDGTIRLWPVSGGAPRVFPHPGEVWSLAVSPSGRHLASIDGHGVVSLWDLATGVAQEIYGHGNRGMDLVFSADGTKLASSGIKGVVHVHDLRTATSVDLPSSDQATSALVFSPDGSMLYGASYEGSIRAWKTDGSSARVLLRTERSSRTIALSPDGRTLAVGGMDQSVRVVDLASGRVDVLPGHEQEVRDVSFSADGKLLASAGFDGSVRSWDLENRGAAVRRGHRGRVHRVEFSPDGRWLASAGMDGTVSLWEASSMSGCSARGDELHACLAGLTTGVASPRGPVRSY